MDGSHLSKPPHRADNRSMGTTARRRNKRSVDPPLPPGSGVVATRTPFAHDASRWIRNALPNPLLATGKVLRRRNERSANPPP
ncbi:hypothetical protein TNCT_391321 [Trichonephila clavata]|uniref:Uncharacterized protein n=1 Tax=Trichonephila clavata TaxID=2740835 RepID=A0A8X6I0Q4_TRICU|nr:hypothetical protein TNCT_391321 [Trichonephila clavata]